MSSIRRLVLVVTLAGLAALSGALPAAAYIVVLEDGSTITASRPYEIRDGQAIITLPNGTRTSIDAAEIDRAATEKANRQGYGDALVIDDGTARKVNEAPAPEEDTKGLADLARRETSLDRLAPHRRADRPEAEEAATTTAGYPDLVDLVRQPFVDLDAAAEVQRFFRGQGIDGVELYQGTRPDHLYADVTTASEASVFRAIEVAAEALLAARESHPQDVAALELLLTTPERHRAGQFVLTPDLARELVSGAAEVSRFFVEHVQF